MLKEVTINGRPWLLTSPATYEMVVHAVYTEGERRLMSVTYGKGACPKADGILAPGESVEVADGMIFNAYHTGNA